jgi:hypothetical protein
MQNGERQAVLILGMHRSGTSAVAGVISFLGAAAPVRMVPSTPENPSGYWEPAAVVAANDRILGEAGSTWYDCLGFDSEALDVEARRNALTYMMLSILTEFGNERLLLLKDPRICLLLDLWLPALQTMAISPVVLLVLRHPNEVIASLEKRDGLPAAYSAALWLRYVLAAEYATRGCRRHILCYEELLGDWRGTLRRADAAVGAPWSADIAGAAARIEQFLRPELRHHSAAVSAPPSVRAPLRRWVDDVYAGLLALAAEPGEPRALERLDRARAAFGVWCRRRGAAWGAALLADHPIRTRRPFGVPASWAEFAARLQMVGSDSSDGGVSGD